MRTESLRDVHKLTKYVARFATGIKSNSIECNIGVILAHILMEVREQHIVFLLYICRGLHTYVIKNWSNIPKIAKKTHI